MQKNLITFFCPELEVEESTTIPTTTTSIAVTTIFEVRESTGSQFSMDKKDPGCHQLPQFIRKYFYFIT